MREKLIESLESVLGAEDESAAIEDKLAIDAASVGQVDISQQTTMGVVLDSIIGQNDPPAQNELLVQSLGFISMAVGRRMVMRHLGSIDSEIPDLFARTQHYGISIENLHHDPARRQPARR
jgi:hypothetical protein